MPISFYTIRNPEPQKWNVLEVASKKGSTEICSKVLETHTDKKAAELAAVHFSRLYNTSYVPEDTSVVTVFHLLNHYLAVEITPLFKMKGCGICTHSLKEAIVQASNGSKSQNLPYITPNFE